MINVQTGPSQLFHSVRDHVRQALKLRIPELLPSGDEASELVQQTARQLRELLTIPDSHDILFVPDAHHFINETIRVAGDNHGLWLTHDHIFSDRDRHGANNTNQLVVVRHTEETGTSLPQDELVRLREHVGNGLIAADVSLAWPYASLPFEVIDAAFLEFHYGFGLPAGLGAVVTNERWRKQDRSEVTANRSIPASLNLTWVSVLGGVIGDMLSRGIITIRRETEYKSSLIYHLLDQHHFLHPAVGDKALRSRTVIAARAADLKRVQEELRKHAISAGFTGDSVVFANFPSHSKEQYERLADILSAIR